jgi:predicted RND superfamily exporter protein
VTDSQFSTARMTLMAPWRDALEYAPLIRLIESDYASRVPDGVDVQVTGMIPLLSRTFEAVITSMSRSYVLAVAIITPLMMLLLASVRLGLLSMVPNVTPIILTLAFMTVFDFPLDGFTLLLGSIALGLAVDDTIHFMHGFNRNYDETGDVAEAVRRTLATSGQAMFVTSCVLCIGFAVFTLGYMQSLFNFGVLTSLSLVLAFIADVTLAPALMVLVRRARPALSV